MPEEPHDGHPRAPLMPDPCPLCGLAPCRELFFKDNLALLHCPACRLTFTTAEPKADSLPTLYGREYFTAGGSGYRCYVGEEATHRFQARRYLDRLTAFGPPGTLLDVGCAAGFFLDEARQAGWAVHGLDVSPFASEYARTNLGLDVVSGGFLDADLGTAGFDLVTMFNVLEHLAHPIAVEQRLCEVVRPGGVVAIETWNCTSLIARLFGQRWQQYDPRYVPYYYSPTSLRRLFPPSRWTVLSVKSTVKWISLKRGLEIVADRGGILTGILHRLAATSFAKTRLPYVTGDLLLAVLERRPSGDHSILNGEH